MNSASQKSCHNLDSSETVDCILRSLGSIRDELGPSLFKDFYPWNGALKYRCGSIQITMWLWVLCALSVHFSCVGARLAKFSFSAKPTGLQSVENARVVFLIKFGQCESFLLIVILNCVSNEISFHFFQFFSVWQSNVEYCDNDSILTKRHI